MNKTNPFKEVKNNSVKYQQCLEYLKECSNDEIIEAVDDVLKFIEDKKQYSMSRLYALWNVIFERNETPQTCSSCLIRKSQDLKKWRENQTGVNKAVLRDYDDLANVTIEEVKKTPRGKRKEV